MTFTATDPLAQERDTQAGETMTVFLSQLMAKKNVPEELI
jgi:hypothetical protein